MPSHSVAIFNLLRLAACCCWLAGLLADWLACSRAFWRHSLNGKERVHIYFSSVFCALSPASTGEPTGQPLGTRGAAPTTCLPLAAHGPAPFPASAPLRPAGPSLPPRAYPFANALLGEVGVMPVPAHVVVLRSVCACIDDELHCASMKRGWTETARYTGLELPPGNYCLYMIAPLCSRCSVNAALDRRPAYIAAY
jgi:hypothetical protein